MGASVTWEAVRCPEARTAMPGWRAGKGVWGTGWLEMGGACHRASPPSPCHTRTQISTARHNCMSQAGQVEGTESSKGRLMEDPLLMQGMPWWSGALPGKGLGKLRDGANELALISQEAGDGDWERRQRRPLQQLFLRVSQGTL